MANGFGFTMRYTVNFEQATADFDIGREHQLIVSQDGKAELIDLAGDGYEAELAYFVDCVQAGRAPTLVTAEDAVTGLRSSKPNSAASSRRGGAVGGWGRNEAGRLKAAHSMSH